MRKLDLLVLVSLSLATLAGCTNTSPVGSPSLLIPPTPPAPTFPSCSEELSEDFNTLDDAMVDPFFEKQDRMALAETCKKHTGNSIQCMLTNSEGDTALLDVDAHLASILASFIVPACSPEITADFNALADGMIDPFLTQEDHRALAEACKKHFGKSTVCVLTTSDGISFELDVDTYLADSISNLEKKYCPQDIEKLFRKLTKWVTRFRSNPNRTDAEIRIQINKVAASFTKTYGPKCLFREANGSFTPLDVEARVAQLLR